jgi:hypothetical protein
LPWLLLWQLPIKRKANRQELLQQQWLLVAPENQENSATWWTTHNKYDPHNEKVPQQKNIRKNPAKNPVRMRAKSKKTPKKFPTIKSPTNHNK